MGMMTALDIPFKAVKEDWNIYELEDGTEIKVRFNVAKISKRYGTRRKILYSAQRGYSL